VSEYFTNLKNTKFDEVKAKTHAASMKYKRIKWLCEDPNPLRKKV